MFFFAHLLMGLIIGKIYRAYFIELIGVLFVDLDHLIIYFRESLLFKPKNFGRQ